jgi:hypothetical protein
MSGEHDVRAALDHLEALVRRFTNQHACGPQTLELVAWVKSCCDEIRRWPRNKGQRSR